MPPEDQQVDSPSKPDTLSVRKITLLVLLLVVVGFATLLVSRPNEKETMYQVASFQEPAGLIYLTLPISTSDTSQRNIFTYNTETFDFLPIKGGPYLRYTGTVSPSGDKLAYLSKQMSTTTVDTIPLYITVTSNFKSDDWANTSWGKAQSLVGSRLPSWSPDGRELLYSGWINDGQATEPADWRVARFEVGSGNLSDIVGIGAYPVWSPDGASAVVLGQGGLRLIDLSQPLNEGVLILPLALGPVGIATKFSFSKDKSKLVVSEPYLHKITLYDVQWGPFKATETKVIKNDESTQSFWPVFSPDNQYLAVYEVENEGLEAALVIYNLFGMQKKKVLDLRSFDLNAVSVTDWR